MREENPQRFSNAVSIVLSTAAESFSRSTEDGIAALHIGRDILEAEFLQKLAQLHHFDDAVATDIDAGKQRDEGFSAHAIRLATSCIDRPSRGADAVVAIA